ncbi:cytochrome c oxidase assembly factor Coa1 family protein [Paenibacillus sp. BC26]|uniref:cytochrome c oxidase assembly factor Coa1 family protein n=1 Tax=Paenibacillus sp. BC26 TaxID=1881032 RepID=UPI0008F02DB6|nr:cytochrome c oxidase assembly factor Coa1 family protein [Paenibacillus sp. BC26]SFT08002.1 Uncharacterized membrane protein YckC, RDD family [Paenibacillus sp. BC26]
MQSEVELVLTWASNRRRVFGFMIDMSLMFAALIIVVIVGTIAGINLSISMFLLPLWLLLRDVFTNRSIGKRMLGLYIVKAEDRAAPSKGALVLRNVLLILGPIELLSLVVQKEGRRLGDLAAKTIVVSYEDRPRKLRNTKKRLLLLASGVVVFFVITVGGTMLFLGNSGAFDAAKQASKQDEQVVARVGEVTGFGLFPSSGSIETSNGEGKASFRFKVKGTKGSVHVISSLHKSNKGKWEVDILRISE